MITMNVSRCIIGRINAAVTSSYQVMFLPATTIIEKRNFYSNKPKLGYKINSLTKSLSLLSNSDKKFKLENQKELVDPGKATSLKLTSYPETKQPLVVMLPWLGSKPKQYHKYAELYLQLGFNVLTVPLTPLQFLWPATGAKIVAKDLLRFLEVNSELGPLLIQGFSVGGYLWGELLTHVDNDCERYSSVMNRISGHIWDSFGDVRNLRIGVPEAIFPKNAVLRKVLHSYLGYHLTKFHDEATQHYNRSCENFHMKNSTAPALLLVSRADYIGTMYTQTTLKNCWDSLGRTTYMKVFDNSPHVSHYRCYPEEYVAEIAEFLTKIQLISTASKMQARV